LFDIGIQRIQADCSVADISGPLHPFRKVTTRDLGIRPE
jgi:hypothetical protein